MLVWRRQHITPFLSVGNKAICFLHGAQQLCSLRGTGKPGEEKGLEQRQVSDEEWRYPFLAFPQRSDVYVRIESLI